MSYKTADDSIKQANTIFSISTLIFTVEVLGLLAGGIAFLCLFFVSMGKEPEPNWLFLIYSLIMFVCIIPAWGFKQVIDGIGKILHNTGVILYNQLDIYKKFSPNKETDLDNQIRELLKKKADDESKEAKEVAE